MKVIVRPGDLESSCWGGVVRSLVTALEAREEPHEIGACWNTIRPNMPKFFEFYAKNPRIVSLETPVIGRKAWYFNGPKGSTYYRMGRWGCSGRLDGCPIPPDLPGSERFEKICEHTGFKVEDPLEPGKTVIYALQVPGDASLRGTDPFERCICDLYRIRQHWKGPVVVAVHPDCHHGWAKGSLNCDSFERLKQFCALAGHKMSSPDEHTSDFFPDAWCLVSVTSGVAVEAIAAGVRCITLSQDSFMSPICARSLEWLHRPWPVVANRDSWFQRLAYAQWTQEEIESGVALEFLFKSKAWPS